MRGPGRSGNCRSGVIKQCQVGSRGVGLGRLGCARCNCRARPGQGTVQQGAPGQQGSGSGVVQLLGGHCTGPQCCGPCLVQPTHVHQCSPCGEGVCAVPWGPGVWNWGQLWHHQWCQKGVNWEAVNGNRRGRQPGYHNINFLQPFGPGSWGPGLQGGGQSWGARVWAPVQKRVKMCSGMGPSKVRVGHQSTPVRNRSNKSVVLPCGQFNRPITASVGNGV